MPQDNTVTENTCLIPTFERNRYFAGKPMMVGDFEAEQQYLIGKNRLQNRLIHGAGIICGLKLSNEKIIDGKLKVEISEGAALDCCGNLIVVNKPTPVEVRAAANSLAGGAVTEGKYYLYIRYSECIRQPIMATTNAFSCEEVCCYNRIRETFEVVLGTRAPAEAGFTFKGAVKTGAGAAQRGIVGARVRALHQGVVKAHTLSGNNGEFSLGVPSGDGVLDIEASATGYSPDEIPKQSIPAGQEQLTLRDFVLTATAGPAPAEVCNELVQRYFDGHSSTCEGCDDPKVFLGIVNINGTVSIDRTSEANRDRAVVYTNPMLHDLYCDHVSDFNNPHRTTASQVKALQNINGVGNSDDRSTVVPRIDLVSDGTIKIVDDPVGNKITISGPGPATQMPKAVSSAPNLGAGPNFAREDHVHTLEDEVVQRKHLSDDTFEKLVFSSDSSIKVTTKPGTGAGDRQIDMTTKVPSPATRLPTRVTLEPSIGTSASYAREDHAHSLAKEVVNLANLSDDVINKLVSSDATITITKDLDSRTIRLNTNPGTDVTSVGAKKNPGTSLNFARQDHMHNLLINERGPNEKGQFLLTAGANVRIEGGEAANELIISTKAPDTLKPSRVTTGLVRFEGVKIEERRTSLPIKHGLDAKDFAIVLAVVGKEEMIIGDRAAFNQSTPQVEARYKPGTETFVIDLRNMGAAQVPVTFSVRWWAIPSTTEMEPVVS